MTHSSRILAAALMLIARATLAAEIPLSPLEGVLPPGAAAVVVSEGYDGTEGPVALTDGTVLFTENRADRILRISADDTVSLFLAGANGSNALALDPRGDLVSVQTIRPAIGVVRPAAAPLATQFEGAAFGRPNDLVISRAGDIYLTDPGVAGAPGTAAPTTAVYHLRAGGGLQRVATDLARPNGVALSPDDRVLYVANTQGEWVVAFELGSDGSVGGRRDFARVAGMKPNDAGVPGGGADGLAVDGAGRLFVATGIGVQVFDARGEPLGVIALPRSPQNLAFGGPNRDQLYVVGRGSVYRIPTLTRGPANRGK